MKKRRLLTWLLFWAFVVASWTLILGYAFFAGWSSCEIRQACNADRTIGVLLWVLMPIQVLIAVLIKQRLAD
jgi:hypothetical protein